MAGERSKRVRLRLTLDVDYEPGTDETGDNFYYTLVDVELADQ